jgi:hypothetical protein
MHLTTTSGKYVIFRMGILFCYLPTYHSGHIRLTMRYMAPDGITGVSPGTVDSSEKQISEFD